MNAEEELLDLVRQETPVSPDEARAAVQAFVHELAEKQREYIRREAARRPLNFGSSYWAIVGADRAADFIDPEVPDA